MDEQQNEYITSVGNRFFNSSLNISIYDIPAILEPSQLFTRDFNHSATLHLPDNISYAEFASDEEERTKKQRDCFVTPLPYKRPSASLAFNKKDGMYFYLRPRRS